MSIFPVHYYLSSPYMIKEMNAALQSRAPFLLRRHRQQLARLRKGDQRCSSLIDDKDRAIVAAPLHRQQRPRNAQQPAAQSLHTADTEDEAEPDSAEQREDTVTDSTACPAQSDSDPTAPPSPPSASFPSSSSPSISLLSPTASSSAFRYPERPLLLFWLDGAQRFPPFHLASHCIASHAASSPPHPLALVSGGSLGLESSVLDNKSSMMRLLAAHRRSYIPSTAAFALSHRHWRTRVSRWLAEGEHEGEEKAVEEEARAAYAIFKPSLGLKQKGLLVVRRRSAALPEVEAHVAEWGRRYDGWVMQSLVMEPFCVSGLDLGLVAGAQPPPALYPAATGGEGEQKVEITTVEKEKGEVAPPVKGRRQTLEPIAADRSKKQKHFSFPLPSPSHKKKTSKKKAAEPETASSCPSPAADTDSSATASPSSATASPSSQRASTQSALSIPASPSESAASPPPPSECAVAGPGQLPSDSGKPMDCLGLHKVHFRVYALLRHDATRDEFALFTCRLFKLYHAEAPSARIVPGREKEEAAAKLLTAMANTEVSFLPLCSMSADGGVVSCHEAASPCQSISNNLAMRLGNDILSPQLVSFLLSLFTPIVVDCISLALPQLRPYPHMSTLAFQLYGFDFLFDTARREAVLLEVNDNVGQGIHSQELMLAQGMTAAEYARMRRYWTEEYRRPFSEDLLTVTVDYVIGRESREQDGVWQEAKRWEGGVTQRERARPGTTTAAARAGWKLMNSSRRRAAAAEAKPSSSSTDCSESRRETQAANAAGELSELEKHRSLTEATAAEEQQSPAAAVAVGRKRRRSSHKRLELALQHGRSSGSAAAGEKSSRPFLTGLLRATSAGADDIKRRSKTEIAARYAVRARRASLDTAVKAAAHAEHSPQAEKLENASQGAAAQQRESRPANGKEEAAVSPPASAAPTPEGCCDLPAQPELDRRRSAESAASHRSQDWTSDAELSLGQRAQNSGALPLVAVC